MSGSKYGEPSEYQTSTTIAFGQGKLTGAYADLSRDYEKHQSSKQRDFVAALVRPLLPNPLLEGTGSHLVHVVANRLKNRVAINLTVKIRTGNKSTRIAQQPENRLLPIRYVHGIATVTVPKVVLHSMLVIE